jgi:hypothetical protein
MADLGGYKYGTSLLVDMATITYYRTKYKYAVRRNGGNYQGSINRLNFIE